MAATTSTVSAILKRFYRSKPEDGLNKQVPFFSALEEAKASEVDMGGEDFRWLVRSKRSGGVGAIGELATLPTAGNQTYVQANETSTEVYGRLKISQKLMDRSSRDSFAFMRGLEMEVTGLEEELRWSVGRQLIGNKVAAVGDHTVTRTGVIAQIETGATGTSWDVDGGFAFHLYPGMKLRVGTAAEIAGDSHVDVVVSSISDYNTFVSTASVTLVADDLVTVGDANYVSYQQELKGLAFAVDDEDTHHGVAPGTHPVWKSVVNANSGTARPMTHELMDAMPDMIFDSGGERPDYITGHSVTCRTVKQQLEADVRYAPFEFKGGYKRKRGLTWNNGEDDVPIVADRHVPYGATTGKLYFLTMKCIKLGYEAKFRWLDADGARLSRIQNQAGYEATYGADMQLLCLQRNTCGLLDDIKIKASLAAVPA